MPRSREPQDITKQAWYYENLTHLLVVHEVYDGAGIYLKTDQIKIPWRMIEASLKRVRPAKRRKRTLGKTEQ